MSEPIDPDTGARPLVETEPREAPVAQGADSAPPPPPPPPPAVDRARLEDPPSRESVGVDERPISNQDDAPVVGRTDADDTAVVRPRVIEDPDVVEPAIVRPQVIEEPVVVEPAVVDPVDRERTSVLRVPTFSPVAPIVGLLTAWGAVVLAVAILTRAGVGLGFNLGIADGGPGESGFWAGVWLLVVNGGGFVFGGYTAARLARANGVRHAVLVWVVAMMATGADALVEVVDSGVTGVVRLVQGVPFWADTALTTRGQAIEVLAIFAGVSLGGAIIGGIFGQTANRIDRTDDALVRT